MRIMERTKGLSAFLLLMVFFLSLSFPQQQYAAQGNQGEAGTGGEVSFYVEETEKPDQPGKGGLPNTGLTPRLPQTGTKMNLELVGVGVALLVMTSVMLLRNRRDNHHEKNCP